VDFVRARLGSEVLDPAILTIGFARRFVPYKRATMLLSQVDRLRALITSEDRPVQLVLAGKAHPADEGGKEMIRRIVQFSHEPSTANRVVFVEDYDIAVAKAMVQGCDVWLNIPRRPQEACGTSGQKAALNGALNLSILDGWWDELYDGQNGWAITSMEGEADEGQRDAFETANLFDTLEASVVPLFYRRLDSSVPKEWVRTIRLSLSSLGPQVVASRMVSDYVSLMYQPAGCRVDSLSASGYKRARALARWKAKVSAVWPGVSVIDVESNDAQTDLGGMLHVETEVELGSLDETDVTVELVHGPVLADGEFVARWIVPMVGAGGGAGRGGSNRVGGSLRYTATFSPKLAGSYGFTVRVVPFHEDMASPYEMGLAARA
jgi:starch phosphorylase